LLYNEQSARTDRGWVVACREAHVRPQAAEQELSKRAAGDAAPAAGRLRARSEPQAAIAAHCVSRGSDGFDHGKQRAKPLREGVFRLIVQYLLCGSSRSGGLDRAYRRTVNPKCPEAAASLWRPAVGLARRSGLLAAALLAAMLAPAPAPAQATQARPALPSLSPVPTAPAGQQPAVNPNVIIGIECHNNHRVPCATIKTRIFTKPGDVFSPVQIHRDYMSLWNSGFFDNVTISREDTPNGIILHINVEEKPLIRDLKYKGIKSITESDISDRNKARNVHLTRDSQFDPTVAKQEEDVIKELESERGRQYATVQWKAIQLPPSSIELDFIVNEGPKVSVGHINFRGNHVINSRLLRRSMKNLHPLGIPDSLVLESIFPKTYDQAKLSEDLESIRGAYQDRGYFTAVVEDPLLRQRNTHTMRFLFWGHKPAKAIDITIPIVEGKRYKVGKLTFINNRFITNQNALESVLGMKTGDVMNISKLRKGLQNLQKLYGAYGYINFVAEPDPRPNEQKQTVDITFDVNEGKPFFIRRIEFSGNTTTRDKVIRRELLVQEGGRFNSEAWQTSLLRLNQLGYFDEIKPEDAEIRQDETGAEGKVDIDLHVHEKGKNSIGLNGGVSEIEGSFLGLNYTTNNFLGLGETLGISTDYGQLQQDVNFSFTEPYFRDRPFQLAFSVFISKFHFDQAREASIFYGENLTNYYQAFGNNLLNYGQNTTGFTFGASYPLPRSFLRLGLTYGYSISSVQPFTNAAKLLFDSYQFISAGGPDQLSGIRTSTITPSLTYNTVNSAFAPTGGHELDLSTGFSGLGGNVKMVEPTFTFRYFHPAWKNHVVGVRLLGSFVTGYGGIAPPSFNRFYVGGEQDIRGFDIMAVTPIALIPSVSSTPLIDPNTGQQFCVSGPAPTPTNPAGTSHQCLSVRIPQYQISTPGGDTEAISNFEYRVPIVGQTVQLAYFVDTGVDMITLHNQLKLNQTVLTGPYGQGLETTFNRKFDPHILLAPGTNGQVRMSTGLELAVMLPIIQAPLRVYYAVNPMRVDTRIYSPILFTKNDFIQSIQNSYGAAYTQDADVMNAVNYTINQLKGAAPFHFQEAPHVFRFTIGRTF
jgi:outer membrane protein insertion porin family